jgi:hypothetical protein
MYAEEVKPLPRTKSGRADPLATSRIKAELQVRFWLPIAQMLNPLDRTPNAGAAAQDFYSRGRLMLRPHEMEESLALMKRYLGVPRLTFGTWFRLQPIFRDLLGDALTHHDMDLVVCAVREFVRLELGQARDPGYGQINSEVVTSDRLNDEYWCPEDEFWLTIMESEKGYMHWGIHENNLFVWADAWQVRFADPAAFEKTFPGMPERRSNMAHALKPIFDRDWVCDAMLIDDAVRYAKALLAIAFEENRLPSKPGSDSVLVDAA